MNDSAPLAHVLRQANLPRLSRGGGVESVPYVGSRHIPGAQLTTGVTIIPPGGAIALHSHNVEETILVLEGAGVARIGDDESSVTAGDATWVPAGTSHRFANPGTGELRIYWVYAGPHVTRTVTATGETFEHLSDGRPPENPTARAE